MSVEWAPALCVAVALVRVLGEPSGPGLLPPVSFRLTTSTATEITRSANADRNLPSGARDRRVQFGGAEWRDEAERTAVAEQLIAVIGVEAAKIGGKHVGGRRLDRRVEQVHRKIAQVRRETAAYLARAGKRPGCVTQRVDEAVRAQLGVRPPAGQRAVENAADGADVLLHRGVIAGARIGQHDPAVVGDEYGPRLDIAVR